MSNSKLEDLTLTLLEAAQAAGADAADSIAINGTSVTVDVRSGDLEQAERAEAMDVGLRVLFGQRQAVVSSSNVSAMSLAAMAERAVAMAKEAPEDPYIGLAEPDQLARNWDVTHLELSDPSAEPGAEELKFDALTAESAALENPGISQVQQATAAYGARDVHLSTSAGFSGGYRRTDRAISCVAIAGSDQEMERDYSGDSRIFQSDLRSPSDIGTEAAMRACERLGARKPPTGQYPVLFDERVSSTLIGHLLAAANGSSVARGGSWLRDSLHKQVLPKGIDLVEDPHRPRTSASRPFDGEGLLTRKRTIVEDGVLQGWTLDLSTGRKLGMPSSANAGRGPSGPPTPATWNVSMTQGSASRDDLIREVGTGLLVTSMIGSTINPNTGDYSRGAAGMWIENGEIAYPVNECTIAGNLHDMLRAIVPANDARTWLSRVVPSVLIPVMTLAGN